MTDLQTLDALHARLDVHPDDWSTRLVLADLLTDLGRDDEAACQRWMVWCGRRPWHSVSAGWWVWYFALEGPANLRTHLPLHVYKRVSRVYKTRRAAESALLEALLAAGEI